VLLVVFLVIVVTLTAVFGPTKRREAAIRLYTWPPDPSLAAALNNPAQRSSRESRQMPEAVSGGEAQYALGWWWRCCQQRLNGCASTRCLQWPHDGPSPQHGGQIAAQRPLVARSSLLGHGLQNLISGIAGGSLRGSYFSARFFIGGRPCMR
jgi:hypothetical protein